MDDAQAVKRTGHHDIEDPAQKFILRKVLRGGITDGDTVKFHPFDDAGRENHDPAPVIGIGFRKEPGVQLPSDGPEKLSCLFRCFLDQRDAVKSFLPPGLYLVPDQGQAFFFI